MYAARWARGAVVYLAIGSIWGIFMSATQRLEFRALHAHIQLVGWASMAILAALFKVFPALEQSKLTKIHFWSYQIIFPVFMINLMFLLMGNTTAESVIPITGMAFLVVMLMTGFLIWPNVSPATDSRIKAKAS
jgi:hypothetical protein